MPLVFVLSYFHIVSFLLADECNHITKLIELRPEASFKNNSVRLFHDHFLEVDSCSFSQKLDNHVAMSVAREYYTEKFKMSNDFRNFRTVFRG